MSCARLASLLVAVAIPVVHSAAADSSPTSESRKTEKDAAPPLFTESATFAPASPAASNPIRSPEILSRPRGVSAETAAQLSALGPKFDPALAKGSQPAEPKPDLRETDKPRNTIIRLPNYVVREDKTPILKERELRTPKASLELALNKYPGLRVGSFWIFRNDGIALAMLAEEERLERKREFEDLAGLMRITDPAAAANAKREVQKAFLREADFGR